MSGPIFGNERPSSIRRRQGGCTDGDDAVVFAIGYIDDSVDLTGHKK